MASLSFETSLLYPDIKDIIESHPDKYSGVFEVEVKLHTELSDLTYTDGVILNNIYILRDYINNISDYMEVQLTIPLGTFLYDVYGYLDNIEVTLITQKQLYNGKMPHKEKDRYKAIYLLEKNSYIPNLINYSKSDLNNRLPVILTLQLIDRSVETIRIKTTQGNFDKKINSNKDMSITGFLKSIISEQVNKILIENKQALDNIDIEKPDNEDELKAVTIPSNTRIVEIPELIQTKNIGVYNAGIGNYIQKFGVTPFKYNKTFYVYSLYSGKKYDKSEYKIIFYSPVTSSTSLTDTTYKYKDKVLKILPHNISKIADNKETMIMSYGSGIRYANVNSFMKKPVDMTDSGPSFKKNQLVTEIAFKDRKDNLNFAPNSKITGNPFKLVSDVLVNQGNYVTVTCSNLDHDFLFPGAPCKIVYESLEHKVKELYGVIHRAIITYTNDNTNLMLQYNNKTTSLVSTITLDIFSQT